MSRARQYERLFAKAGRRITLERAVPNGQPIVVPNVRARITRDGTDELIGGLDQKVRKILVLAADVPFSPGLRRGDQVVLPTGERLTIELSDADTHCDGDELLAYELVAKG